MLLEVYPDVNGSGNGLLFGGWFTYDAAGDEDWVSLQGNITSSHGSSYDLTIGYGSGGNFNAGPVTHPIANGSATLTFNDCTHATFVYNFTQGPGSGVIPYTRVTSPTGCSDSVPASFGATTPANYNDVLHSGAWYNPATSGQGILVDIVPSQSTFAAAWFTYAPQSLGLTGDSTERWFTLQTNSYTPGNLALKGVPIYASRGGNFNQSAPPVVSSQVGTANVTFLSCTAMTIDYVFKAGEFKGLSGSINEQNLGPVVGCQ